MNQVCRTCLEVIENQAYLFSVENKEPALLGSIHIRTKLEACVPEIAIHKVRNSVICRYCLYALNTAYDFKTKCLQTETKLSEFVRSETIDSADLSTFIKRKVTSGNSNERNVNQNEQVSLRPLSCEYNNYRNYNRNVFVPPASSLIMPPVLSLPRNERPHLYNGNTNNYISPCRPNTLLHSSQNDYINHPNQTGIYNNMMPITNALVRPPTSKINNYTNHPSITYGHRAFIHPPSNAVIPQPCGTEKNLVPNYNYDSFMSPQSTVMRSSNTINSYTSQSTNPTTHLFTPLHNPVDASFHNNNYTKSSMPEVSSSIIPYNRNPYIHKPPAAPPPPPSAPVTYSSSYINQQVSTNESNSGLVNNNFANCLPSTYNNNNKYTTKPHSNEINSPPISYSPQAFIKRPSSTEVITSTPAFIQNTVMNIPHSTEVSSPSITYNQNINRQPSTGVNSPSDIYRHASFSSRPPSAGISSPVTYNHSTFITKSSSSEINSPPVTYSLLRSSLSDKNVSHLMYNSNFFNRPHLPEFNEKNSFTQRPSSNIFIAPSKKLSVSMHTTIAPYTKHFRPIYSQSVFMASQNVPSQTETNPLSNESTVTYGALTSLPSTIPSHTVTNSSVSNSRTFLSTSIFRPPLPDFHDTHSSSQNTIKQTEINDSSLSTTFTNSTTNISLYKCNHCQQVCSSNETLREHIDLYHIYQGLKCTMCDFQTNSTQVMDTHLKSHSSLPPPAPQYKCGNCDFITSEKALLKEHKANQHANISIHQCGLCNFRSTNASNLRRHMKIHMGLRPHRCPECRYGTSDESSLKIHMEVHKKERPHKCTDCSYAALKRFKLKKHMLKVHNKVLETPELIKQQSGDVVALPGNNTHLSNTDNNPYKVSLSDIQNILQEDENENTLESEEQMNIEECTQNDDRYMITIADIQRIFQGDDAEELDDIDLEMEPTPIARKFRCSICSVNFRYSYLLKKHMRMHVKMKKKVFKCVQCNFHTIIKSHWEVHKKTHTGGKIYRCEQCQYSTIYSSKMRKHTRVHSSQKAFKCMLCEFQASQKATLKNHMLSLHADNEFYNCNQCYYSTNTVLGLIDHVEIHSSSIGNHFMQGFLQNNTTNSEDSTENDNDTNKNEEENMQQKGLPSEANNIKNMLNNSNSNNLVDNNVETLVDNSTTDNIEQSSKSSEPTDSAFVEDPTADNSSTDNAEQSSKFFEPTDNLCTEDSTISKDTENNDICDENQKSNDDNDILQDCIDDMSDYHETYCDKSMNNQEDETNNCNIMNYIPNEKSEQNDCNNDEDYDLQDFIQDAIEEEQFGETTNDENTFQDYSNNFVEEESLQDAGDAFDDFIESPDDTLPDYVTLSDLVQNATDSHLPYNFTNKDFDENTNVNSLQDLFSNDDFTENITNDNIDQFICTSNTGITNKNSLLNMTGGSV